MVVRAYYMNSSPKVTTAGNSHISPLVIDCMFKLLTSVKGESQRKAKKHPERTKHVRATINIHNKHSWRIGWALSTNCFPPPLDICAKIISQSDHLSSLIRKALFLFNLSPHSFFVLYCIVSLEPHHGSTDRTPVSVYYTFQQTCLSLSHMLNSPR
jgi:hypothetical protein